MNLKGFKDPVIIEREEYNELLRIAKAWNWLRVRSGLFFKIIESKNLDQEMGSLLRQAKKEEPDDQKP